MNSSLWYTQKSAPRPVFNGTLESDLDVDLAIVGGGFTGLWTAYYANKLDPTLRIAIIESDFVGFGASGRNGGWVSALFPAHFTSLARASSREEARRMQQLMVTNIGDIGQVAHSHNWDIDWAHGGTVVAARSPLQNNRALADVKEFADWGFPEDLTYLTARQTRERINATDVVGGTFTPHCAAIDPYKLVHQLSSYLHSRGVSIFEGTRVLRIEPGVVNTTGGTVLASNVIRATEGYTKTLHGQKRSIAPVYSLMVATQTLSASIWEEIGLSERETFSDYRNLIIYGQRTADDRIAFGGRGAPYHFNSKISPLQDTNQNVHKELRATLIEMFPVLQGIEFTNSWGGPLGIARDWWASCNFDPKTGLGSSSGYVGDGVGTAHLGGKTLAHLITRTQSELTTLPWVNHVSRKWEPEPLRWIGANLGLQVMQRADSHEQRTGKNSRSAAYMSRMLGH
jgi:glycine/D-amino acid oxidase-like deaminating enzyme